MSVENHQNAGEQLVGLQTIDDISFEVVNKDDSDFDTALTVINTNGEKTEKELLDEAEKEAVRLNWWLQEYWQRKGIPREQISIRTDNLNIELYNYGQELNPHQLEDLERVIARLSKISIPNQGSKIRYITIDNEDQMNDQNGENKRGYAFPAQKMISLYPRAVSPEPHRIENTSGLAGTVAHEFGHIYLSAGGDFWNGWRLAFGWKMLPDDQVDWKKPAPKTYGTNQSGRCVTEYAQFSPDEDVCESLAATINNPDVLDAERLAFIKEHWFKVVESKETETNIQKKVGKDVELPKAPDKIKYKVKVATFRAGVIT